MSIAVRNPRGSQAGMFLMTAFLVALTLLALSATVLMSGKATLEEGRYLVAAQRAGDAASGGVHLAIAKLNAEFNRPGEAGFYVQGGMAGTGKRAQRYQVLVFPGAADGLDNDLDGSVDESDESEYFEMNSTGRCDAVMRASRVTLQLHDLRVAMPAPLVLAEEDSVVFMRSNASLVSGEAVDSNGVATIIPLTGVGLGVMGDPALLDSSFDPTKANIVGDPPIAQVPAVDIDAYVELLAPRAQVLLDDMASTADGTVSDLGPGVLGTIEDPRIVYSKKSVSITSKGEGAGVMIVEGDLSISGGFSWTGLLIVRGALKLSGGGGEVRLIGGAIVEGTPQAASKVTKDKIKNGTLQESEAKGVDLYVKGSVQLLYSPEAIGALQSALFPANRYVPVSWRGTKAMDVSE